MAPDDDWGSEDDWGGSDGFESWDNSSTEPSVGNDSGDSSTDQGEKPKKQRPAFMLGIVAALILALILVVAGLRGCSVGVTSGSSPQGTSSPSRTVAVPHQQAASSGGTPSPSRTVAVPGQSTPRTASSGAWASAQGSPQGSYTAPAVVTQKYIEADSNQYRYVVVITLVKNEKRRSVNYYTTQQGYEKVPLMGNLNVTYGSDTKGRISIRSVEYANR